MGKGQNVPAPRGVFFHYQNCNFPEECFILSTFCYSVQCALECPLIFLSLGELEREGIENQFRLYLCTLWTDDSEVRHTLPGQPLHGHLSFNLPPICSVCVHRGRARKTGPSVVMFTVDATHRLVKCSCPVTTLVSL